MTDGQQFPSAVPSTTSRLLQCAGTSLNRDRVINCPSLRREILEL
ncbi:hypothetical protein [Nostoc sp.]